MSSPPKARKNMTTPLPRKQDLGAQALPAFHDDEAEPTPIHSDLPTKIVANGEAFKIIIVGNKGVGKTRMINKFVNGSETPTGQEPGNGSFETKTVLFSAIDAASQQRATKSIRFNFHDTANQERYKSVPVSYYR